MISHIVNVRVSNNHVLISNNNAFFVLQFRTCKDTSRGKFRKGYTPVAAVDTALFFDVENRCTDGMLVDFYGFKLISPRVN